VPSSLQAATTNRPRVEAINVPSATGRYADMNRHLKHGLVAVNQSLKMRVEASTRSRHSLREPVREESQSESPHRDRAESGTLLTSRYSILANAAERWMRYDTSRAGPQKFIVTTMCLVRLLSSAGNAPEGLGRSIDKIETQRSRLVDFGAARST
jgi:hypothetical protein